MTSKAKPYALTTAPLLGARGVILQLFLRTGFIYHFQVKAVSGGLVKWLECLGHVLRFCRGFESQCGIIFLQNFSHC